MLSEINQARKYRYSMTSQYTDSKNVEFIEVKNRKYHEKGKGYIGQQ
jgi:hypothetical protein